MNPFVMKPSIHISMEEGENITSISFLFATTKREEKRQEENYRELMQLIVFQEQCPLTNGQNEPKIGSR